ncbi:DUF1972 domain-containing protein [Patiriisocius hiemis]|uniref:DUF1972 domain-containing protein n=1 Tax=Patiriisocius hiemis TaxID=3075604 RepID=A0ABU2YCG1_9FLAO|nr:DUF1972 domain-containing protein [Constantimarinum sp. W242]MDT0555566.1 DUF1972 domain-containing protein [Constantimarinum sp. W242]
MKIGILGTRGIPNHHGGFEQFAEFFAVFLAEKNHEVYVYNSHLHPYKESLFNGVHIIHCKDAEDKLGTAGQFIYDLNCIRDARKRDFDILLQLGYTSNSVWYKLLPKSPIIITNMDGLEWKRSKYSKKVRKFLKIAEKLAVKSSDYLIADSIGIQNYLKNEYQKDSTYIPYGAFIYSNASGEALKNYNVERYNYNMLIARMEPENNIEVILDGVAESKDETPFLVVGKHNVNKFGNYLTNKYKANKKIRFLGGIYDQEMLNNLRYYSKVYFHGHSVGGTNPSLLEAMGSNSLIIAHNNEFNKAILKEDAFYFTNKQDVTKLLGFIEKKEEHIEFINNNTSKVKSLYSWDTINNAYLDLFIKVYENN